MTDTNELIPEEVDERDQRLIHDLRHLYPTSAQVAQPLARIQQRLFHGSDETLHNEVSTRPALLSQGTQQARTSAVNTKGRAWQRRFSTLAAAIFAALLVGALSLVLNQAHQSRTGRLGTSSNQTGAVAALYMVDATTGWALTGNAVLRTYDGGAHWKDVTPRNISLSQGSIAEFYTASLAWIATRQTTTATAQVLRTTDGGQSWQTATIQATSLKEISFIDARHGWLLAGGGSTGGAAETVNVLRTSDGGKTWRIVSSVLPASTDAPPPGHLPFGGQKSGIHFLNASTGWVSGTVTVPGLAWLYVTHDGGDTWHQQTLPLPSGIPSAKLSIQSPTFFSATDGLLPVRFSDLATDRDIATVIYVTHDAGTTWQSTTPVSAALSTAHFLDMQHGWVTDGTILFRTDDGGYHWTRLTPGTTFKNVTQLDFVSRTTGWAISGQGNASSLLKTMDGGQTWEDLHAPRSPEH